MQERFIIGTVRHNFWFAIGRNAWLGAGFTIAAGHRVARNQTHTLSNAGFPGMHVCMQVAIETGRDRITLELACMHVTAARNLTEVDQHIAYKLSVRR